MMVFVERSYQVVSLLLFLVPCDHVAQGGPTGQYFLTTPTNTTVNTGQHVRLPCSVGSIVGTCQWTRDGFALGNGRDLAGFSRYLLAGESEDVCDLTIDPVLPLDEGEYQCQVSGGHGVGPIISSPVTLSVNSEPGNPYIVQAREVDMMELQEGEEVELQCESQGGRPPAEIMWWDGDGRRIVSDVTEHVRRMQDRKTFKTVSNLKFRPTRPIMVKCTARNEAFPEAKNSNSFQIKFKGQVELEILKVAEGESFQINCGAPINKDGKYQWFINEKEIVSENTKTLKVEHFVAAYDNSVIKCMGKNKRGDLEMVTTVKLNLDISIKKELKEPLTLPSKSSTKNKHRSKERNTKSKQLNVKKTIFTCTSEEDAAVEPTSVLIKGKLGNTVIAEDDHHQKFNCRLVKSGYNKLNQMAINMKHMFRTFKKMSRGFSRIVTPMDSM